MGISIKTESLTKKYREEYAVNSVDLNIESGEIYGLVGENGAGKTTIMKMLVGLIKPDSGKIVFYDKGDVNEKVKIGCILEEPALYENMTAFGNMSIQYEILGLNDAEERESIEKILKDVGLDYTDKKKVKTFSLGMKQRLGLALALLGEPDILVLDEPINGLDPLGIREIRELILNIKKERDITVLVSSHIIAELNLIADKYGIIHKGVIIDELTAGELNEKIGKKTSVEDAIIQYLK